MPLYLNKYEFSFEMSIVNSGKGLQMEPKDMPYLFYSANRKIALYINYRVFYNGSNAKKATK